jgi:hypothetical protein
MKYFAGCGDVLLESGGEAITVFGHRAEQTRPVTLSRQRDRGPRAAGKSRGTRLDLYRFLSLIDADHGGIHLPPLLLSSS